MKKIKNVNVHNGLSSPLPCASFGGSINLLTVSVELMGRFDSADFSTTQNFTSI